MIKKIVFSSPEAMVEFSGEKNKTKAFVKTLRTYANIYSSQRSMNDLPVIGYHAIRNELWDRQGANIASRKKEMYGEKLFPRLKKRFYNKINTFSP